MFLLGKVAVLILIHVLATLFYATPQLSTKFLRGPCSSFWLRRTSEVTSPGFILAVFFYRTPKDIPTVATFLENITDRFDVTIRFLLLNENSCFVHEWINKQCSVKLTPDSFFILVHRKRH